MSGAVFSREMTWCCWIPPLSKTLRWNYFAHLPPFTQRNWSPCWWPPKRRVSSLSFLLPAVSLTFLSILPRSCSKSFAFFFLFSFLFFSFLSLNSHSSRINYTPAQWDAEIVPVLEAFLLDNFGFSSYHISGKQLASNCDALFLQMGLNYALFPCQNVSQVVAWFDPVVFFPWLLSCEHFDYATLLPSSSSLFGTENIDAYNQFRFSKGENQFSQ